MPNVNDRKENGGGIMSGLENQLSEKWMIILRLTERLGIPLILLSFVCWGIFQGVSWTGINVIQPMMKSHVQNLETVQDALKQQTTTMSAYAASISSIERTETDLLRGAEERKLLLTAILDEQKKTTIAIESLNKKLSP
jgi:hypothetical protein